MRTVSRDELHRTIEQLPDDRLTVAAELLEALALNDRQVGSWRQNLSPSEETEISASLRREHTPDEWVTDEAVAEWIDSVGAAETPPASRSA
jgi:hypothetical protein